MKYFIVLLVQAHEVARLFHKFLLITFHPFDMSRSKSKMADMIHHLFSFQAGKIWKTI